MIGLEGDNPADRLTVSQSTFIENSASRGGGGLAGVQLTRVERSTFERNTAWRGGGIYFEVDPRLDGSFGGEILDSVLIDNATIGQAGGFFQFEGATLIEHTRISGNRVIDDQIGPFGGGVLAFGDRLVVRSSEISDNAAVGDINLRGGGLVVANVDETLVINSTIAGNQSSDIGGVLVVVNEDGGSRTNIVASTVTDNTGEDTGGLAIDISSGIVAEVEVNLAGSILAGNGPGDSPIRDYAALDDRLLAFNLVGTNVLGTQFTDEPGTNSAVLADDPMLMPLDFYGGATRTMPPMPATGNDPGSPAYNAGNAEFTAEPGSDGLFGTADDVPLETDARGLPRNAYGTPDLGAAEFVLAGDANLDGTVNLVDFLILRNNFSQTGLFAEGDFNRDGTIDLSDFLILRSNFGETVIVLGDNGNALPRASA